ncbi:hypothetical protein [Streptomyces cinnamoneus]|uniref:DNA primase/polymerase bifunctional N-terminal domain-containing protein n=1 Tax=Streptomyces cinnamoneus TaxID=53446 RepID=A0A918TCP9_STRCJ|nr:hypothetical protein [Streptomyces cinnamoneus]GHC41717.1 hypothetical protein GCM10010507_15130 [Streptomyces cinnamoneus]
MSHNPFTHWLARAATDPHATVHLWDMGCTAPLLTGRRWDVVQVDFALATAAVAELRAQGHHVGPYLMSGTERAMWWLLPLGAGRGFVTEEGVIVYPPGWALLSPPPGKYLRDRVWVLPEEEEGDGQGPRLTSPGSLRAALDAAGRALARKAAAPAR